MYKILQVYQFSYSEIVLSYCSFIVYNSQCIVNKNYLRCNLNG